MSRTTSFLTTIIQTLPNSPLISLLCHNMALKSVNFVVSGTVQGVGFRYFVKGVAKAEGLVGWVKNETVG